MNFLLLDTCGAEGSVAAAVLAPQSGSNAESQSSPIAAPKIFSRTLPTRNFAARVITAIREALAESGVGLAQLSAIVVVRGPGSFTGVRVGLSVAKGLAQATGLPVIALSRLAVMASISGGSADAVLTALDAGRGEFYFGRTTADAVAEEDVIEELLLPREELLHRAAGHTLYLCEPAALAPDLNIKLLPPPTAADALPLALRAFARRDFADIAALDANYLRPADVERAKQGTQS